MTKQEAKELIRKYYSMACSPDHEVRMLAISMAYNDPVISKLCLLNELHFNPNNDAQLKLYVEGPCLSFKGLLHQPHWWLINFDK